MKKFLQGGGNDSKLQSGISAFLRGRRAKQGKGESNGGLTKHAEGRRHVKQNAASLLRLSSPKVQPVESAEGGRTVFQITEASEGVSAGGSAEPLRYSFTTPKGYQQIIDPSSNTRSGTFISQVEGSGGSKNDEYMTLRGKKTAVEATADNLRKQIEWLEQELLKLDRQRLEMDMLLQKMEEEGRSEFTVTVGERRDVDELPIRDEELQEMSRLVEGLGQAALPLGGEYTVLHTGEFLRQKNGADPSMWLGWEMHVQSGERNVAVMLLRRKYIPDTGFSFQDFVVKYEEFREIDPKSYSPEAFFSVIRSVADSIAPIPTKANPLEFDRIDIIGHLEKLQGDEGYMSFFQERFDAPDNRPSMSDKADEFVEALSSVLGTGGGMALSRKSSAWSEADIFEDTIEAGFGPGSFVSGGSGGAGTDGGNALSDAEGAVFGNSSSAGLRQASEKLEQAWQLLKDMTANDDLNGLLVEQAHEYFFLQTEEGPLSAEEEARRERRTQELRHEWSQRVARYLAFCVDGALPSQQLHLKNVTFAIMDPYSRLVARDKEILERVVEFCVNYRVGDAAFVPGSEPTRFNIADGITSAAKQEEVSGGDNSINDVVLAKLLKLQYVRHVCDRKGQAAYPALLVALLARKGNAKNLTLQVSKELAGVACNSDTMHLLQHQSYISSLVYHLQIHGSDEMVLYYLSMTLDRLAKVSPSCRIQLSASGLTRVVVPQLLRSNQRVRTVFLRLLEHVYGSSRGL